MTLGNHSRICPEVDVVAWHLRNKPSGVPKVKAVRPIQPVKPEKPIKPVRPVKPIAPVGKEYYWRDD